jgi:hypothetical protein
VESPVLADVKRRRAAAWQGAVLSVRMDHSCEELFDRVWAESWRWRRVLHRRWRYLPDLDAEIRAAMWERVATGVVEQRELFAAACVAVRRAQRHEARQERVRSLPPPTVASDPFEEVERWLDVCQVLRSIDVPARSASWVRAKVLGEQATPAEMQAGQRWARSVRQSMDREVRCVG